MLHYTPESGRWVGKNQRHFTLSQLGSCVTELSARAIYMYSAFKPQPSLNSHNCTINWQILLFKYKILFCLVLKIQMKGLG